MNNRHVIIQVGGTGFDSAKPMDHPKVEFYRIDGPDTEHKIDMALLNDLVVPLKLVFVGGEEARRFAELYHADWIESGPTAVGNILRMWEFGS